MRDIDAEVKNHLDEIERLLEMKRVGYCHTSDYAQTYYLADSHTVLRVLQEAVI